MLRNLDLKLVGHLQFLKAPWKSFLAGEVLRHYARGPASTSGTNQPYAMVSIVYVVHGSFPWVYEINLF